MTFDFQKIMRNKRCSCEAGEGQIHYHLGDDAIVAVAVFDKAVFDWARNFKDGELILRSLMPWGVMDPVVRSGPISMGAKAAAENSGNSIPEKSEE